MTDIESLAHALHHRPRIYIACPYSVGDKQQNVRNAVTMAQTLSDMGFTAFNPILNHYAHEQHPRSYEEWMQDDMMWLQTCRGVYRMPGESKGADREEALAIQLNIPVFRDLDILRAYFNKSGPWTQPKHLPPDGLDDVPGNVRRDIYLLGSLSVRQPL